MAEKEKQVKKEKIENKEDRRSEVLIRILSTDIPGQFGVYHGLTRIKGISWMISNAVCNSLNIPKTKKVSELTEKEINTITEFIKSPKLPAWLLNKRREEETGESKHLITSELDLSKDFDIRKMKKMKSYKGWRHALGQPVRGQRTRSHFRKGASMGVMKAKARPGATAPAPAAGAKK